MGLSNYFKKLGFERTDYAETKEEIEPNQTEPEEVQVMDNADRIDDIMEQIIDRVFMTPSPIDGSLVSVVRVTEVMDVLCAHFGVDGKDTKFSEYAS